MKCVKNRVSLFSNDRNGEAEKGRMDTLLSPHLFLLAQLIAPGFRETSQEVSGTCFRSIRFVTCVVRKRSRITRVRRRIEKLNTTVFFGVLHPRNVHNLMGWVQEYEKKIQRKTKIPLFMYSIHV